MKQVGYFCSEEEITSLNFITDSMLAIVIATKRVLVLNTEDFLADKVEKLTH